jgi:hypothetical protein
MRYSTDIGAAWQVIEKVGVDFFIDISNDPESWCVTFGRGMDEEAIDFFVHATSAPLAICRGAIKATELLASLAQG